MTTFEKGQLIYEAGEDNKTFFFLQKGFVKIGSITEGGAQEQGDVVEYMKSLPRRRYLRSLVADNLPH